MPSPHSRTKPLMLDEPFGALDMLHPRRALGSAARRMAHAAATVVLVTHDLREAVFLADRIVVMSARPGRVLASYDVTYRVREPSALLRRRKQLT